MVVELACATALAPAYDSELFRKIAGKQQGVVVFVVCGGFKVSLEELIEYRELIKAQPHKGRQVLCDGEEWIIREH